MPRPIWKGYISFGLVNIPVVLYPAEKRFDIQFKLIDSRDNARVRYIRVNENTGAEVPWNNVAKGYEYEEGDFVVLKEEDFKAIAGENNKTINIDSFVTKSSLDYMDFDKPYYLVPDKKGDKGYVILRETLKNVKKVGVAKVTIHTRQYLAVVMPYENALVLNLLHYHQELRKPTEFDLPEENIKSYKITSKEIDMAKKLIDSMTEKWDPEAYHDEFREALQVWVEEKISHAKPSKKKKSKTPHATSNVINFVDLLKKSLTQDASVGKKVKSKKAPVKSGAKVKGHAK
ncbi:MAG: non-homologous end joining protein Ku [Gammaproteobacteria bacterium]